MKVGQFDRCPECRGSNFETLPAVTRPRFSRDAYGQEMQFVARKCKDCGQVLPPMTGQHLGVIISEDSIEYKRDNVGFTHPNLHRRILYCLCGQEWVCQLHKHIHKDHCPVIDGEYVCGGQGHCNCSPGVVCDCATTIVSHIRALCLPPRESISGVINGTSITNDTTRIGTPGYCHISLDIRKGRSTSRHKTKESYKIGIQGFDSVLMTEVHLHHEEQTHKETP